MSENVTTQLQVATDGIFNNIIVDKTELHDGGSIELTDDDFSGGGVPEDEVLYTRIRYSSDVGNSPWSSVVDFIIRSPWGGGHIYPGTPVDCGQSVYNNPFSISVTTLSPTQCIVCYSNANQSYLYAQLLTVSGSTITAGTPVQCNSNRSEYISVTTLSPTQCIVCYRNASQSYRLYAQLLTVSGTTITAGTPVQCNIHTSYYISVTTLSPTQCIVCYRNARQNNYLHAQLLTLSGTTITVGDLVQCNSHTSAYISVTTLSPTQCIVCYRNDSQNNYLHAQLLTLSGTTITVGDLVQCNSYDSQDTSVTTLSPTQCIVCYRNRSSGNHIYAQLLTVSGSTITVGTPVQCNSHTSYYISVTTLSPTQCIVCYRNASQNYHLYAQLLTVSGSTITAGTPVQCNSYDSQDTSVTTLSPTQCIVCYRNVSQNDHLYAQTLV